VLSYDLGPHLGELLHTGSRKTERGESFRMGKGMGVSKSYKSKETLVLYCIYVRPGSFIQEVFLQNFELISTTIAPAFNFSENNYAKILKSAI
jgi:hypothetical protein